MEGRAAQEEFKARGVELRQLPVFVGVLGTVQMGSQAHAEPVASLQVHLVVPGTLDQAVLHGVRKQFHLQAQAVEVIYLRLCLQNERDPALHLVARVFGRWTELQLQRHTVQPRFYHHQLPLVLFVPQILGWRQVNAISSIFAVPVQGPIAQRCF